MPLRKRLALPSEILEQTGALGAAHLRFRATLEVFGQARDVRLRVPVLGQWLAPAGETFEGASAHSLRLGAELRRQRVEANAIRDGLESVRRRKEILAQKIGQSVANHEDIRERLRKLAEAERSLPHPLTRAESAFQTTLQANADDLPLLEAKLEELKRRCEEIGEDFATMGRMAAGDHVSSFEKLAASDPEIAKEVESQDAATRANLERVRQIELAVGSLDGV